MSDFQLRMACDARTSLEQSSSSIASKDRVTSTLNRLQPGDLHLSSTSDRMPPTFKCPSTAGACPTGARPQPPVYDPPTSRPNPISHRRHRPRFSGTGSSLEAFSCYPARVALPHWRFHQRHYHRREPGVPLVLPWITITAARH